MLNKKKIAIAATGIVIMICGVLVYVSFINKEPTYNYIPRPDTAITEQQPAVEDEGITIFVPDKEPITIELPAIDWEEPPVVTVYNPIADINNDGHVDKVEWEKWVSENPADLNQDLYIEDSELAEFNKTTQEEQKPVETKPVDKKPVENKPVETKPKESKPVEDKPAEKPTPPATNNGGSSKADEDVGMSLEDLLNWGSDNGKTQEEKDAWDENFNKPFDPVN